jgi:flagellar biosynthetic protein FlhF
MKIKKFEARNFREALTQVKKELGNEAVILSSEEINGLKPMVEVVAAIDQDTDREEPMGAFLMNTEMGEETGRKSRPDKVSLSTYSPVVKTTATPAYHDQVIQELQKLRESLEELRGKGYEVSLPEDKKRMYQYLKNRFIREDLALQLTEKAACLNDLSGLIRNDIHIGWDWSERKTMVLIGSTGVGKTTTAAKLCGQAIKQNKKVGLVSLDTFRIGAIEQIRIYSRILGVPLFIASSPEDVRTGLNKLQDRDLVIIDTTGRNPKDQSYLNELKAVYDLGIPMETHLLISGNSSEYFMTESLLNYQNLPINWIAFTKMDEAGAFGPVYNLAVQAKKPIAYITNGQRVPNDIEFYNNHQLADLILNHNPLNSFKETNPIH